MVTPMLGVDQILYRERAFPSLLIATQHRVVGVVSRVSSRQRMRLGRGESEGSQVRRSLLWHLYQSMNPSMKQIRVGAALILNALKRVHALQRVLTDTVHKWWRLKRHTTRFAIHYVLRYVLFVVSDSRYLINTYLKKIRHHVYIYAHFSRSTFWWPAYVFVPNLFLSRHRGVPLIEISRSLYALCHTFDLTIDAYSALDIVAHLTLNYLYMWPISIVARRRSSWLMNMLMCYDTLWTLFPSSIRYV